MLVTAVLYAPSLGYGFVYEDNNDPETFFRPFEMSDVLHKPARVLTVASYALSNAMAPRQAWGYHAGNLALHLLNGWLLFVLASSLMAPTGALFAAALFWLHPVQVESVAYISSRADLLATTFVILALLWRAHGWLTLACCVLAVLAKETAVMVFLLMPLIAYATGIRWAEMPRMVWALVIGAPFTYLLIRYSVTWDAVYASSQLAAFSRLLLLLVWPSPLTIDHDWTVITPQVGFVVVCAWIALTALAALREWPAWSWALGMALLLMVPRAFVPLHEGLHEHHLLMPSVGLALWAGYALSGEKKHGISETFTPA